MARHLTNGPTEVFQFRNDVGMHGCYVISEMSQFIFFFTYVI